MPTDEESIVIPGFVTSLIAGIVTLFFSVALTFVFFKFKAATAHLGLFMKEAAVIGMIWILIIHYISTGKFSGQIWSGFVGGFFFINAIVFFVLGLLADMFDRIRKNQEKILLQLKKMGLTSRK